MEKHSGETTRTLDSYGIDLMNVERVVDIKILDASEGLPAMVIIGDLRFDCDDFLKLSSLVKHLSVN